MDNGFILLHRSILEWEWWGNLNTSRLWITLLLLASWQEKRHEGLQLQAGQVVATYPELSELSGLSYTAVRVAINHLKTTGEIAVKVTNKYSLITIANWTLYQQEGGKKTRKTAAKKAGEQQANNRQTADNGDIHLITNKQGNNETSIGTSRFTPPTVEEIRSYCKKRNNSVDPQRFYDYYQSNGWKVGKNPMKDWQAAIRSTWEKGETGKAPARKTFYDLALEDET